MTKEGVAAALAVKPVPSGVDRLFLRPWTVAEREEFVAWFKARPGGDEAALRAKLVGMSVCDRRGRRFFRGSDAERAAAGFGKRFLARSADRVRELNGIAGPAPEVGRGAGRALPGLTRVRVGGAVLFLRRLTAVDRRAYLAWRKANPATTVAALAFLAVRSVCDRRGGRLFANVSEVMRFDAGLVEAVGRAVVRLIRRAKGLRS